MIPFTIASKTIKFIGMNLTKEMKGLYIGNYETLGKELEGTDKWKIICIHELEEFILLKYPYYPKPSIDSVQSLSSFPWHFFFLTENKKILKFVRNHRRPQIAKAI